MLLWGFTESPFFLQMKVMKSHGAIAACLEAWPQCRHCPAARPVSCSRSTLPFHPSCSMDNKTNQSEALALQRCTETPTHTVYHQSFIKLYLSFFFITFITTFPLLHFHTFPFSLLHTSSSFPPWVFLSSGFHWVLMDTIKKNEKMAISYVALRQIWFSLK